MPKRVEDRRRLGIGRALPVVEDPVNAKLTLFNGAKVGGKDTVFVYVFPDLGPTFVSVCKVTKKVQGSFDYTLDCTIPPIKTLPSAPDASAVSVKTKTVKKTAKKGKTKYPLIVAPKKCSGTWKAEAEFFFRNGERSRPRIRASARSNRLLGAPVWGSCEGRPAMGRPSNRGSESTPARQSHARSRIRTCDLWLRRHVQEIALKPRSARTVGGVSSRSNRSEVRPDRGGLGGVWAPKRSKCPMNVRVARVRHNDARVDRYARHRPATPDRRRLGRRARGPARAHGRGGRSSARSCGGGVWSPTSAQTGTR